MKSWLPLLDRILVKRDEAPRMMPDPPYLEIPEDQRENYRPFTGKVVKVGPGRRYDDGVIHPVAIPEGAHVMFSSTGGTEVEHEGVTHLMMREVDVFLMLDTPQKTVTRKVQTPNTDAIEFSDGSIHSYRNEFEPSEGCDLATLLNDAKKRGLTSLKFGALRTTDREALAAQGYHVDSTDSSGSTIVSWPA